MQQNNVFLVVVVLYVACEVTGKAQLDVSLETVNLETTAFWKLHPTPEVDIFYSVKYTNDGKQSWTFPAECQKVNYTYCVLGVFDNSRTFSNAVNLMADWTVCVTATIGSEMIKHAESCKSTNQKFDGTVTCPTENDVKISTSSRKVGIYVQSPKSPYRDPDGVRYLSIDDLKSVFSIYVKITIRGRDGDILKDQEDKLPLNTEFTDLAPNSLYNISINSKYGSGPSYATDDDNTCIFHVQTLEETPEKPARIIDTKSNENHACLSHDVRVEWEEPDKQYQHGKITHYDVHYSSYDHAVIDSGVVTVNASKNYATLSDLSCWKKYKITLVTWNSVGNISGIRWEIDRCNIYTESDIDWSKPRDITFNITHVWWNIPLNFPNGCIRRYEVTLETDQGNFAQLETDIPIFDVQHNMTHNASTLAVQVTPFIINGYDTDFAGSRASKLFYLRPPNGESIIGQERGFPEVIYIGLSIMIVLLLLLLASPVCLCYRKYLYPKNKFNLPVWLESDKYKDMCTNAPFHKDSNPTEVFDQLLSPSDKKLPPQNPDVASSEIEPLMITLTENVISEIIEEQSTVDSCSYANIDFETMSKIQEENNMNIENTSISVIPAETSESSGMSSLSKYSAEQYVKADFGFPMARICNDSGYVTNMPIATTNYLPVKPIVSGGSPVQTQVL